MASKNQLYVADNLDVLNGLNSESVDLIYLDPPFNSKRMYRASIGTPAGEKGAGFHDIWVWNDDIDIRLDSFIDKNLKLFNYIEAVGEIHGSAMKAYLTFMVQRIIEMYRVLKSTGSFYLHCDPTASHYLKIILDEVFGINNFRNEIIWSYSGTGKPKKKYKSKSDTILFYTKSGNYVFNMQTEPYTNPRTIKRFDKIDGDGKRYKIWTTRGVQRKVYMKEQPLGNVWSLNVVGATSKERTNYPTQKPLSLLNRIIKTSSKEGDMVLDPFCGCATTCVAAQQLHRNWIGIDISDVAVDMVRDRLTYDEGHEDAFTDFTAYKNPPIRSDIETINLSNSKIKAKVKQQLFGDQRGVCNGCAHKFDFEIFDLDHIRPQSKGGANHMQNFQLLCRACNTKKGDRPMDYLLAKLKARRNQTEFF